MKLLPLCALWISLALSCASQPKQEPLVPLRITAIPTVASTPGLLAQIDGAPTYQAKFAKLQALASTNSRNLFAQLRKERPVFSLAAGSGAGEPAVFVISRYADVRSLLKVRDSGGFDLGRMKGMAALLAQQAVRNGATRGTLDLVKAVARPVALGGAEDILGFSGPSRADLWRWAKAGTLLPASREIAEQEMRAYLTNVLLPERVSEVKGGRQANDLATALLGKLPPAQVAEKMIQAQEGDIESSARAIANSLFVILSQPELRTRALQAAAAGQEKLVEQMIWEALRFRAIAPWISMMAKADIPLGQGTDHGTIIPKGSLVLVSVESAMWDEAAVNHPEEFRFDRAPQSYLFFQSGLPKILVSEAVKLVLRLPELAIAKAPQDISENLRLSFLDPDYTVPPKPLVPELKNRWFEMLTFTNFMSAPKILANDKEGIRKELKHFSEVDGVAKAESEENISHLAEMALSQYSEKERKELCETENEFVAHLMPDDSLRSAYCSTSEAFRTCYSAQRLFGEQSSFVAYNACAYGRGTLKGAQRKDFEGAFGKTEAFSFLSLNTKP